MLYYRMGGVMGRIKKQLSAGKRRAVSKRQADLPQILHDILLIMLMLALAFVFSALLAGLSEDSDQSAIITFILAVALTARFTQGYWPGAITSVFSVFCVNYWFTYPYHELNFTITGYPLTFIAMLIVSVLISTLTTQIKHQEQLRMEAEMEKMRANLLRSISHDLRTPLTSILGASSVLMENETLGEQERYGLLTEMNKDAQWLVRITENILSVTRFSGSDVSLKKEDEVVEEVVSGAIVKFRKNHPSFPIHVDKPEEILCAPMDATLIEQVILNLLDNVPEHGGSVTRISIRIADEIRRVRISVEDNGTGIAPAKLPHLFDGSLSFTETQSDGKRNMGIGLSVCRSIIRAHGGDIYARNIAGGGALFEFYLPTEREDNEHA